MLDLGWPEMLVIAIVLIVVVGPKDLPKMMRAFGRTTSKIRSMAGEFRKQFDDAIKEAELDEVRNLASEARKLNPASELKKALSPMERAAKDVKAGLDTAMNPTKPAAPASGDAKAVEPAKDGAAPVAGKASARPLPEAVGAKRAEAAANAAKAKTAALAKPAAATKPAAANKPAATATKATATPTKTAAAKPKPSTKSAASAGIKPAKPASVTSKAGAKN